LDLESVTQYLLAGAKAAGLLVGAYLTARLTSRLIVRAGIKAGLEESAASFFASLAKMAIYLLAVTMALSSLGIDTSGIVAGTAAVSFAVGFAMQQTLGNLAAGMMVAIYRPLREGDYVEVKGFKGIVVKITAADTTILAEDGTYVWLPNSTVWGNPVKNETMGLEGIGFRVRSSLPPGELEQRLREILGGVRGVAKKPEPLLFVRGSRGGSEALAFCWAVEADGAEVKRELGEMISQLGEVADPFLE